ncbi:MAG: hypothetical protein J7L08_02420, partial [Candidatus Aenigmarchaeota archaeon]|nr:hypothetical protein [Candidatus Aenigmarchaeota archaeon]
ECYDTGDGWKMIEGPDNGAFKSENAFETVGINENVTMIDLCTLDVRYQPATIHKIAWVKFTTSDKL